MSTRTTLRPKLVITAASMATDQTSTPTILNSLTRICYQATWSGSTAVGTLAVQVSNDYALEADGTAANTGTWTAITVDYQGEPVATVPVTGTTGSAFIDGHTGAYAVRLKYTYASGAGTINATVCGKVS